MNRKSNPAFRCHHIMLFLVMTICGTNTTFAASLLGGLGDAVEETTTGIEETTTDVVTATTDVLDTTTATTESTLNVESSDTGSVTTSDATVAETSTADTEMQTSETSTLSGDSSTGTLLEVAVGETSVTDSGNKGGVNRSPNAGSASKVLGAAQAAVTTSLGSTQTLADTGELANAKDTRLSSSSQGEIEAVPGLGGLLSAEVIHATTTAGVDQVDSTASLADLSLDVAGIITLAAEFVRSEAWSTKKGSSGGGAVIEGLTIAGDTVTIDGVANQVVPLLSGTVVPTEIGRVIINEHESIAGGVRVNAVHVIVYDVGEIIIASSTAAFTK